MFERAGRGGIGLVHILPEPILMQPNRIGVSPDELIHRDAINGGRAPDSLHLPMDEDGHELLTALLTRALLGGCQLSFRLLMGVWLVLSRPTMRIAGPAPTTLGFVVWRARRDRRIRIVRLGIQVSPRFGCQEASASRRPQSFAGMPQERIRQAGCDYCARL